ncbi:helix-turn-helix domain-containing protein [Porphyrobacter sp. LM 6]|uniref:helix-turn-helix domain-containing protein n=1 Tax=Porphyrobacter sp. LM 6 TaxID=1896196 RepID=UPI0008462A18|nr:helix-turn-helix domain-containing protein [Porphyrobacter sp. LM 6]AOL93151.1 transcriptional regulator, AraC family [Porphyrobacter sp. LM 6]
MRARAGNSVQVRFALPAEPLRPFVTTYYCTDVTCSPFDPWLEDYLHPEWANIRFLGKVAAQAMIGPGDVRPSPAFAVTGPTSRSMHFRMGAGRSWGIGLMPQGWAALFGVPAADYADRYVDAQADPAFAAFVPLAAALAASSGDYAEELALIEAHMARIVADAAPVDSAIAALNAALVDPEMIVVADLAARLDMNVRSLERLCLRAFGFPPKLLLRRQRFLRSLERFMLDPSLKWLGVLGSHYHDQSHFVRDFKRFMGMSPSDYARLDKPLMLAAAQARMAAAGHAVQGLHTPAGVEPA